MATDSMLRPGELKDILLKAIEAADLGSMDVNDVGTVLEVKDGVALIYGLRRAIAGEMLEFPHGVFGIVNGRPGISTSPSAACFTFVQNPRSRKCESALISATSNNGPQSTFASRAAAQISRFVCSLSHMKK